MSIRCLISRPIDQFCYRKQGVQCYLALQTPYATRLLLPSGSKFSMAKRLSLPPATSLYVQAGMSYNSSGNIAARLHFAPQLMKSGLMTRVVVWCDDEGDIRDDLSYADHIVASLGLPSQKVPTITGQAIYIDRRPVGPENRPTSPEKWSRKLYH